MPQSLTQRFLSASSPIAAARMQPVIATQARPSFQQPRGGQLPFVIAIDSKPRGFDLGEIDEETRRRLDKKLRRLLVR